MKTLTVIDLTKGVIPTASTNYDFKADHFEVFSLQVVWTSTTASFSIQPQLSLDGTNFANIGTAVTVANNSGSTVYHQIDLREVPYVRLAVTKTSGALTALKLLVANTIRV